MKAIKSIFDKSYIVKAQAIAAGAKEWPQGTDVADLQFDEATRKYRWVKAGVLAKWAETHDAPAETVSLAEALEESGETIAELKDEPVIGEFSRCPGCDIHLSNGVGFHMQDVNGKAVKHSKFEYECLACGHEFGPNIADLKAADAVANANMGPKAARPRLSSCLGPTKKVWHIADSMPKASRKDVMDECVRQGIAYGTARTQYQAWFKASQNGGDGSARKPYEKA